MNEDRKRWLRLALGGTGAVLMAALLLGGESAQTTVFRLVLGAELALLVALVTNWKGVRTQFTRLPLLRSPHQGKRIAGWAGVVFLAVMGLSAAAPPAAPAKAQAPAATPTTKAAAQPPAPVAPTAPAAAPDPAVEEAKAEAVRLLGAAGAARQRGDLGVAWELGRQAVAKWPAYAEAKQFVTEVEAERKVADAAEAKRKADEAAAAQARAQAEAAAAQARA